MLVDSFGVRRWLMWPWCGLRGHREVFWLNIRWNGVVTEQWGRCSCGRRQERHPGTLPA
jgi:hypothetical protein